MASCLSLHYAYGDAYSEWCGRRTLTRQQLLASTIPWHVQYWNESEENRNERFLAAEYANYYLDANGGWLHNKPFHLLEDPYTGQSMLPKFRALDKILRMACRRVYKMLVFSHRRPDYCPR